MTVLGVIFKKKSLHCMEIFGHLQLPRMIIPKLFIFLGKKTPPIPCCALKMSLLVVHGEPYGGRWHLHYSGGPLGASKGAFLPMPLHSESISILIALGPCASSTHIFNAQSTMKLRIFTSCPSSTN